MLYTKELVVYFTCMLITMSKQLDLKFYTLHFKKLKGEQPEPKGNTRKEIIKIWLEINKIENRKMLEKISETNNWIFLKSKNIDRTLDLLAKRVLEGIIKISNKIHCYHL